MAKRFNAQIADWVKKTDARMLAVFRTASQYVIEEVRERTPVDTGTLRMSWQVSLNGPQPIRATAEISPGSSYSLEIAQAGLNDVIYASFSAAYAMRVEHGFIGEDSLGRNYNQKGAGMVRLSVQNWQKHVNQAVAEAKAEIITNTGQAPDA